MLVDCDTCTAKGLACGDCVVSVILAKPPAQDLDLDDSEQRALRVLADSGLVPHLRLVPCDERRTA